MSTFRTANLPGSSSHSLGQALGDLFTKLYKCWYDLPKKSTRRHIDHWRNTHADPITDGTNKIADISQFLDELGQMTGVQDAVGQELEQAKHAVQQPDASISGEDAKTLKCLLNAEDPAAYSIQQMVYDPGAVQELFGEVRSALEAIEDKLSADVQQQLQRIWADFEAAQRAAPNGFLESRQPYVDALTKLEKIPTVIRLTYHSFLKHKVDDESQIQTHRGISGSGPSIFRGDGAKSPSLGDGGSGALEEMSFSLEPQEEAVAEAATEEIAADESAPDSSADDSSDEETFDFFPDVRFPERVQYRDEVPLIVQFTKEQSSESRVSGMQVGVTFNEPKEPEYVDVVLSASGFSERTNIWSRTITVYSDQDSQPAVFLLKGEELGEQTLNISFHHQDRELGQIQLNSTISRQPTRMGSTPSAVQAASIAAPKSYAADPVDLELRIVKSGNNNTLAFMLHSSKARVGYHWRPMGETKLAQSNPQEYLEGKFERMSQFAGTLTAHSTEDEIQESMREIETIGEELFEDLFPERLKAEFWKRIKPLRERGVISSLLITSDEPWIPWEMVKPYRYDDLEDEEESDGFLCETFQFCRWLAGRAPADKVKIETVKTVIPELDLAFAQKEQEYFDALEQESNIEVDGPLESRSDVLDNTRRGGFQLLHFAVHGLFQPERVNESPLILKGNEELYPEDLVGSQIKGLRKSKPIVFLNACHTARINFALTGLGGWADKMVNDARVSVFIGTLWEVNDALALAFTTKFYDELRRGHPLGHAFSSARSHIRELSPANPTWLAYTLYGDPNSQISWDE